MVADIKPAPPGILRVDLDALARNYRMLRTAGEPATCGAVVKANAYGLGIGPVARRLWDEGCRDFFVANAKEGTELRALLPWARILVFEGVVEKTAGDLIGSDLVPVLNSIEQIQHWNSVDAPGPAAVHLDTGMSRLGLSDADVRKLGESGLLENLDLQFALTHLACADEPSHPMNAEQVRRFNGLLGGLPETKTSIGGSAAILLGSGFRGDLARPGIAIYGGNPFADRRNPMEPVVTMEGVVLQVRDIARPQPVGYGATHRAAQGSRLATVGVGYADGYPRALGNRGEAFVAGVRVPVVGRVSMDLVMLDVSELVSSVLRPGDTVELLGPNVTLDSVADAAGTVSYELLTRLGPRWQRHYVP